MPEPIKVGFIGGGPRGNGLFNNLISSEEMEEKVLPVACMDPQEQVRKNWRYKIDSVHSTLDSLLKERGSDWQN